MQHLENKYSRTYFQIIERNIGAKHNGYIERHHIIPRSLGGQDKNDNLVDLTAREHFICHWLLTKMFPVDSAEYKKMCLAFGMMLWARSDSQQRNYTINSKTYERLRQQFSAFMSEFQSGKYNSQYGKMWICNLELQQNKKISKSESIPDGWVKGRVLNWDKVKEVKVAEIRTCPCCEKEFEVLESSLKVYCSEKCRAKVNGEKYRSKKRVQSKKKGVQSKKKGVQPRKKRVVKALPQKEVRSCECCGKEFECWESSRKVYCSESCRNKSSYNSADEIKICRNGEVKSIKPQNFNAYKKIGWKKV